MDPRNSAHTKLNLDYIAILRGMWRRHKILMAVTFLAIALPSSLVVYYAASPLYVSQALISVEPSALSQIPFLREPPRSDAIASHLVLLKSRSLSEAVVEALPRETVAELLAQPQYFGYYMLLVKNKFKGWLGRPITVLSPHDQAVAELREARMDFLPSREAPNVFAVIATATSPRVATDLVNTHIQVLLSRSRRVDNEEAKKSREFLEIQYQQVKDTVTRGEEAIAKLQQQKGRLRPGGQTEVEVVRLTQLEGALADAQANRQILSTRIDSLRRALDQARSQESRTAADRPERGNQDQDTATAPRTGEYQARTAAFRSAQEQLTRLEAKLASLRERYTDAHPQVQITHEEIARQQARVMQLARELPAEPRPARPATGVVAPPTTSSDRLDLQNQLAGLERESETLTAREESLKIQVARLRATLRNLSQDELEFSNLRRSVESNRNLMAVLSDRLMAARIREQGDSSVIRIVDPASFPLQPNSAKTQKYILMVIALASAIAFGIAFGVESWRQPVETEADVEKNLGLPVLGSVGKMKTVSVSKQTREAKPILLPGFPAGVPVEQTRPIHVELYRAIRANVETERLKSPFRSILVTSPAPHEGKSTTILNLAHVFQEFGRRVLIIEADLRRPSLSSPLALTNKPGISDFLGGTASFEQVCRRLPAGVSIVPGQVAQGDAASLLASPRFKELLHDASSRYDVILVDSAPLLAVPDNLLLAGIVDRVILVAKATSTSVRDLRRARAIIERTGGRILGVILNQANPLDVPYYHARYRKYYTPLESRRSPLAPTRIAAPPRGNVKRITTIPPRGDDARGKEV